MTDGFNYIPEHHAVCFLTTNREEVLKEIRDLLEKENGYYDLIDKKVLDIGASRVISSWNEKEIGKKKTMIISFHSATREAQNALLKVLEEPKKDTQFLIITVNQEALLPTVRSRLYIENLYKKNKVDEEIKIFLETKPEDRMELRFINDMVNQKDEEGRKDREKTQIFLSKVLEIANKEKIDNEIIKEIADCVMYAGDTASSTKMLMEYVSLRLPKIVL